jgi:hypothetical protein
LHCVFFAARFRSGKYRPSHTVQIRVFGLLLHDRGPAPLSMTDLCTRIGSPDCGFGYRVLPRLNIELGTSFWENHGISVFYDHMSHKGILAGENEG